MDEDRDWPSVGLSAHERSHSIIPSARFTEEGPHRQPHVAPERRQDPCPRLLFRAHPGQGPTHAKRGGLSWCRHERPGLLAASLLYEGDRGRPRARRLLIEVTPTQGAPATPSISCLRHAESDPTPTINTRSPGHMPYLFGISTEVAPECLEGMNGTFGPKTSTFTSVRIRTGSVSGHIGREHWRRRVRREWSVSTVRHGTPRVARSARAGVDGGSQEGGFHGGIWRAFIFGGPRPWRPIEHESRQPTAACCIRGWALTSSDARVTHTRFEVCTSGNRVLLASHIGKGSGRRGSGISVSNGSTSATSQAGRAVEVSGRGAKLRAPKRRHEPGLALLPISYCGNTPGVRIVPVTSSRRLEELQAGGRLVGMYPIGEFGRLSR